RTAASHSHCSRNSLPEVVPHELRAAALWSSLDLPNAANYSRRHCRTPSATTKNQPQGGWLPLQQAHQLSLSSLLSFTRAAASLAHPSLKLSIQTQVALNPA